MKEKSRSGNAFPCRTEIRAGADEKAVRARLPFCLMVLALSAVVTSNIALAQEESTRDLAQRSAIVVLGKVLKTSASEQQMVAASSRTAVILIRKMYAGSEIAGDQTGRTATVILSRPEGLKVGDEALFFGNVRFAGRSLTIADEGEIVSGTAAASAVAELQRGVQARRDGPILERLSVASLVFRGTVETVRPPESGGEQRTPVLPSEHDPQWRIAAVRVVTPLRGGEAGQIVTVLFPASQDIVWFQVPKLKPGQDGVFIVHAITKENAARYQASAIIGFLEKQPTYLVAEPSDVLPPTDEARVRGLLSSVKEAK